MQGTAFTECALRESDFSGANLENALFTGSDLSATVFANTNLHKADFSAAKNYFIDPSQNRVKDAVFTLPEALNLLQAFQITIH